jgi:ABC-type nitrate/sulfonate/bicarbonate transport system substrate-binding protein
MEEAVMTRRLAFTGNPGFARASIATIAIVALLAGCSGSSSPAPSAVSSPTTAESPSAPSSAPSGTSSAAPSGTSSAAPSVSFTPPNLSGQQMRFLFSSGAGFVKVPTIHALGLLKQWGADVSVNYVDSQVIGTGALLSGAADVVDAGPTDVVDAVQAGASVVAFALTEPRYDYVFTCKPSITSLSQLKGVTIGVVDTTGTNLEQAIIVMQKAGYTIQDATLIITGGQSKRVAALLSGRTDCTIIGYYNYLTVKAQGYTQLFNFITDAPDLYYAESYTTRDWLSKHQDMALAYNEALLLSFRWLDDPANKDAFVQLALANVPGSKADQVAATYDVYVKNGLMQPNAIMTDQALTAQMNQLVSIGVFKTALLTNQYADLSSGKQALANVGTAP